MADARKKQVDKLIGKSLLTAEALSSELRQRLVQRILHEQLLHDPDQLIKIARQILAEFEPILARTLMDAEIASWIFGTSSVAGKLPIEAQYEIALFNGGQSMPPFSVIDQLKSVGDEPPVLRFPLIERAAQILADKKIVTKAQFDQLTADAKANAFTVSGAASEQAIAKIRDTLEDLIAEGPSLKEFRNRLSESIETSWIGPGHLETVYRTNIQTAYMQGHDDLASDPIVIALFPYQEYLPIDDGRVRPEHLALGRLGLNGTGIYRADDPFWDVFMPPWAFNCRCGTNLLTLEAAARKGVKEAIAWQRTGNPPMHPEWRLDKIPFRPEPGWGQRPRIRNAA